MLIPPSSRIGFRVYVILFHSDDVVSNEYWNLENPLKPEHKPFRLIIKKKSVSLLQRIFPKDISGISRILVVLKSKKALIF